MKWVKAPEELKVLLEGAMKDTDCEKRPMFGYPAFFINNNMFMGLFQDKVFARLSDDYLASLLKKFPSLSHLATMPGRVSKTYYSLPKELYTDPRTFRKVIQISAEYARSLAPKVRKPRKK